MATAPMSGQVMPQPTPDAATLAAFVAAFRDESGHDGPIGHFAFGDTPAQQDALAREVLNGAKRATAGLHDNSGESTPIVGQHDVVLDGSGVPVCVIRTSEVRVLPFSGRDPAFAWDEGEDDRTLDSWTANHVAFFERHAEGFGNDTLVDFERFSVAYPDVSPPAPLIDADGVVVRAVQPGERVWVSTVVRDTTSADGWPVDRCPALLGRHDRQTAGVLVFVPSPSSVEVVAIALLEDAPGVEAGLRTALSRLVATYGWGPVTN